MHIQTKLNKQRAKQNKAAAIRRQANHAIASKLDAISKPIMADYNARMDAHLTTLQKRKKPDTLKEFSHMVSILSAYHKAIHQF